MSKNTRTRILLTAVAALLLVVVAVGGTMAWLVDSTEEVVNTFDPVGFDITLTETPNQTDGSWEAPLVPNATYAKDPTVAVSDVTTDIYLFVKYEEIGSPSTYLTYTPNWEGWTELTSAASTTDTTVTKVYYRIVEAEVESQEWQLLSPESVTVNNNIVLVEDGETPPAGGIAMPADGTEIKMVYTAYACQYIGFEDDVAGAWAIAQTNGVPATTGN